MVIFAIVAEKIWQVLWQLCDDFFVCANFMFVETLKTCIKYAESPNAAHSMSLAPTGRHIEWALSVLYARYKELHLISTNGPSVKIRRFYNHLTAMLLPTLHYIKGHLHTNRIFRSSHVCKACYSILVRFTEELLPYMK